MSEMIERHIHPEYDSRGYPVWRSVLTPPDNSAAICYKQADRVVPVIFVPGIMGSNLIEKGANPEKAIKWRMDSSESASEWMWPTRGAQFRKRYLRPDVMEVDSGGHVPDGLCVPTEELRRRGWGEIGAMSYEPFLIWLENALNDQDNAKNGERASLMRLALGAEAGEDLLTHDEVALSYRYRFPVHACGYNWLDDNAASAKRLSQRIDDIRARYAKDKVMCDKVIIVTHSMGGLVARHCSEVHERRDDILGVVHGVMPAIGAAAVYRRFKSGTEHEQTSWLHPADKAKASATSSVLGNDGGEMTAVLSSAPGALQLLPTPEYGNGWLRIKDHEEYSLPKNGDPYGDIYVVRGKWWSMCEDFRINPNTANSIDVNGGHTIKDGRDADWANFEKIIMRTVRGFHDAIRTKYHPNTYAFYGAHETHRAYGTVTWTNKYPGPIWSGETRDVKEARGVGPGSMERGEQRNAVVSVSGRDPRLEYRSFQISTPDEPGDGTVPYRSGNAPTPHCRSVLRVNVGHEPAYRHGEGEDNLRACRFTLRAIVKIAQRVVETRLRYEEQ